MPYGCRTDKGIFANEYLVGFWWSSSEYNSISSWIRVLDSGSSSLNKNENGKNYGFSIRCIKD
jgi:uncharacterized protein (TIGR02145 family)